MPITPQVFFFQLLIIRFPFFGKYIASTMFSNSFVDCTEIHTEYSCIGYSQLNTQVLDLTGFGRPSHSCFWKNYLLR